MRPALIPDDENEDAVEVVMPKPSEINKMKPSVEDIDEIGSQEHLKTKKEIEKLRKEYGDEWISKGASEVQNVMGIQKFIRSLTAEERMEDIFGVDSTSNIHKDRTSTPIQQVKHANFAHSPNEVRPPYLFYFQKSKFKKKKVE